MHWQIVWLSHLIVDQHSSFEEITNMVQNTLPTKKMYKLHTFSERSDLLSDDESKMNYCADYSFQRPKIFNVFIIR